MAGGGMPFRTFQQTCFTWLYWFKRITNFLNKNTSKLSYIKTKKYLKQNKSMLLSRYSHRIKNEYGDKNINGETSKTITFYFYTNEKIVVYYQRMAIILKNFADIDKSCPSKYEKILCNHLLLYEFNIIKKHILISDIIWIILDYCHLYASYWD